ncbi:MAG: DUF1194 domain-containing protein, partial [Pseudomonadota bacterium]
MTRLAWARCCASLVCLWFLAASCLSAPAAQAQQVDLEIVLAMDGSGSISSDEFLLQVIGTAAALKDASVQNAILSGPTGRVAIAAVIWSDAAFPKYPTEWHLLNSPRSIDAFAERLLNFNNPANASKRQGKGGGGTGIGDGIVYALEMIRSNKFNGSRKVIDVSGDGVETDPWFKKAFTLPDARQLARAQGVTINGLAILTDNWKLHQYYRAEVISGPGAFVVKAV